MIDLPDHRVNHEEVHTLVIEFPAESVYTKREHSGNHAQFN